MLDIKDKLRLFIRKYHSDENYMKVLFYNILVLGGIAAATVSMITSAIIKNNILLFFCLLATIILLGVTFVLVNKKCCKFSSGTVILIVVITMIFFPFMFFCSGGIESGMPGWFIFGFLFSFVMLDGWRCFLVVSCQVIVNVASYMVAYFHPEIVIRLSSEKMIYFDVLQGQILVALIVGAILKFYTFVFRRERDKTINQQRQLEKALSQAKSANKIKTDFLANMSHEIRTPINAVIGMGEMILRENKDEQIQEYAEIIKNSGDLLIGIINNILDFSKVESGRMTLAERRYSMSGLVRNVIQMIRPRVETKGLEFKVDIDRSIPEDVLGDDIRLKQIIGNLITNAVKYTNTGYVQLSMKKEELEGDIHLQVSVKDTGIGIKSEDMEKVFHSFERVDLEKNRNVEGTGLGLAITQGFIDLMGGGIFVDSEYGKGSNFYFIIPLQHYGNKTIGNKWSRVRESSVDDNKYRAKFRAPEASILAVDDNSVNLTVFTNLLKETEIHIDTALSGQECIELVSKNHYDLVFMDHRMPGMDGIETLNKLKEQSPGGKLDYPVIVLTANAVSRYEKTYIEAGFDSYFYKPIDSDKLEDMILKYLPEDKVIVSERDEVYFKVLDEIDISVLPDIEGIEMKKEINSVDEYNILMREMKECVRLSERNYNQILIAKNEKNYVKYSIYLRNLHRVFNNIGAAKLAAETELLIEAVNKKDCEYIDDNNNEFLSDFRALCHNIEKMLQNEEEK